MTSQVPNNLGITAASFVVDFPEFGNQGAYPPAVVAYYIAYANFALNPQFWGGCSVNAGNPNATPPIPITPSNPPASWIDFNAELLVAHLLALEFIAQRAAKAGGPTGLQTGAIAGKIIGPISVSFDNGVSALGDGEAGDYNLTIYGKRFYRAMMIAGAPPTQLGLGCAPPWSAFTPSAFGPWLGPPVWPGWFWNT